MREKDHGKRLFYHETELLVEFLDRGVTGSAQRYYGTLNGFRQANCLKTSGLLLQSFVIFMIKPGFMDYHPYSPISQSGTFIFGPLEKRLAGKRCVADLDTCKKSPPLCRHQKPIY